MMVPALTSYGFRGLQRVAGRTSGSSTGGAAGRSADGRPAATAWVVARVEAGAIDPVVAYAGRRPLRATAPGRPGPGFEGHDPDGRRHRGAQRALASLGFDIRVAQRLGGCGRRRLERRRRARQRRPDGRRQSAHLAFGDPVGPALASRRKLRGPSHVAVLLRPRALGHQRDECGENHDDEDGADNVEDSTVGPHHWHARRRGSGRSAKLVVVVTVRRLFGGSSGTVLGGRLSATRPLPSTPTSDQARARHSRPLAFKSGATVRSDGHMRTDSADRRWRPRTARGGERGRVQRFQWQLAAASPRAG
jgi:hypothetical protein